jgi:hypothetical protein
MFSEFLNEALAGTQDADAHCEHGNNTLSPEIVLDLYLHRVEISIGTLGSRARTVRLTAAGLDVWHGTA